MSPRAFRTPYEAAQAFGDAIQQMISYAYMPSEQQKPEILAFHWRPGEVGAFPRPHLHIGAGWLGRDAAFAPHWHVPTAQVALADMLDLAIREFGVQPIEREYAVIFIEALAEFGHEHS